MLAAATLILTLATTAFAENIDPDNDGSQYGYGENVGWISGYIVRHRVERRDFTVFRGSMSHEIE